MTLKLKNRPSAFNTNEFVYSSKVAKKNVRKSKNVGLTAILNLIHAIFGTRRPVGLYGEHIVQALEQ